MKTILAHVRANLHALWRAIMFDYSHILYDVHNEKREATYIGCSCGKQFK